MARAPVAGGADRGGTGSRTGGDAPGLMDRDELRAALRLARGQPMSCAVALTKDRQGVILLHKKLKPRKLAAKLKADAKAAGIEVDPSTIRFGRASVDGASDNGRVVFTVHKDAPAAMGRAMLPILRPAGFQRCEFTTDAQLEQEPDGDDAGEGGQEANGAAAPGAAAAPDGQAPSGPVAPGPAPTPPLGGPAAAALSDAPPGAAAPAGAQAPAADRTGAPPDAAAAGRARLLAAVPVDVARAMQAALSRRPVAQGRTGGLAGPRARGDGQGGTQPPPRRGSPRCAWRWGVRRLAGHQARHRRRATARGRPARPRQRRGTRAGVTPAALRTRLAWRLASPPPGGRHGDRPRPGAWPGPAAVRPAAPGAARGAQRGPPLRPCAPGRRGGGQAGR